MSTSPKSTSAKKPVRKNSAASARKTIGASEGTASSEGASAIPLLKKRDLIDAVVKRSGIKKKDAKPVVEAMLAELAEALSDGQELSLPPLGRVKINREKEIEDGKVLILKLRQKTLPEPRAEARTVAE